MIPQPVAGFHSVDHPGVVEQPDDHERGAYLGAVLEDLDEAYSQAPQNLSAQELFALRFGELVALRAGLAVPTSLGRCGETVRSETGTDTRMGVAGASCDLLAIAGCSASIWMTAARQFG